MFRRKAPAMRLFFAPESYHELLFENNLIRSATKAIIRDFFTQKSDDVSTVELSYPLIEVDPTDSTYSLPELLLRSAGIVLSICGIIIGGVLIITGENKVLRKLK